MIAQLALIVSQADGSLAQPFLMCTTKSLRKLGSANSASESKPCSANAKAHEARRTEDPLSAKRLAAAAGTLGIRIFDFEAFAVEPVVKIDRRAV